MDKIYVLDTSILLDDPHSIFTFEDNEIVIPTAALEEIDSKKRYKNEIGRNARQMSIIIAKLKQNGNPEEKISLGNNGTLRIKSDYQTTHDMPFIYFKETYDNRILEVARQLTKEAQKKKNVKKVIIVSNDPLVRIKADALGLIAEDRRY